MCGRRPVVGARSGSKPVTPLATADIWRVLEEVKDPEIPVVSLVEMGIVRSVGIEDARIVVVMTPTFAGCPAIGVMHAEIGVRLRAAGAQQVEVKISHAPPWSSDWITPQGRQRLKEFGLAPPPLHEGRIAAALAQPAACPYCDSTDTTLKNDFGPTLCRAIYVCNGCRQPFEAFKPL